MTSKWPNGLTSPLMTTKMIFTKIFTKTLTKYDLSWPQNWSKSAFYCNFYFSWELDSSRDSRSVIHVSKFTFPEEVEKVKFGFLMLHAGGYDGAGSMTNVYDAFAEASKVLAPIAELKFFACDCGRGKDWGKVTF